MGNPLTRIRVSVSDRRGAAWVVHEAANHRIVLTNQRRPVTVVDSAEPTDASLQIMREAATALLDSAAGRVAERTGRLNLSQVC